MLHLRSTPVFPAWTRHLAPMKPRRVPTAPSGRPLTLAQLETRLAPCLPAGLLDPPASGPHSRDRIYSLPRTFWSWLWQMLNHNAPCREVVRQVQALGALHGGGSVDEATGAYCQARARLPLSVLETALVASAHTAGRRAPAVPLLGGRTLKAVDGSCLRLADTPANQKQFPQPANQKPGCGFPVLKVVVIFCLASGALLARATGSLWDSEARLLRRLLDTLQAEDVVLGDRGFGNFVIAALLAGRGVNLLARVPTNTRHVDFRQGRRLGPHDRIVTWRKGPRQSGWLSAAEWAALPAQLEVRVLRLQVRQRGFRTRELTLLTTLVDAARYPAAELLAAYARRWRLELCLDDLKTTLGLERLRCLRPALVAKELLSGLIAHNLLRCVMAEAAQVHEVNLERLSFKGTLDALRQFSHALSQTRSAGKRQALWAALLWALARDLVPERPGRREPRAIKRRPKYPFLTRPRHLQRDRPRRSVRKTRSNNRHLI